MLMQPLPLLLLLLLLLLLPAHQVLPLMAPLVWSALLLSPLPLLLLPQSRVR
jgi:hypothetical protein